MRVVKTDTSPDAIGLLAAPTVTCVECNLEFRAEDVISIGGAYCCSRCKPIVLQKIREGCADAAPSVLSVTYRETRAAHWRCNLYALFSNKRFAFVTGTFILFLSVGLPLPALSPSAPVNGIFRLIAAIAAVGIFNVVVLALTTLKRFPTAKTIRTSISGLTSEGVIDITQKKRRLLLWRKITEIREHNGDIHVHAGLRGIYIPREAFKDMDEARRFAGLAVELRRSTGTLWPEVAGKPWRST